MLLQKAANSAANVDTFNSRIYRVAVYTFQHDFDRVFLAASSRTFTATLLFGL